jgi:hypothetical protein
MTEFEYVPIPVFLLYAAAAWGWHNVHEAIEVVITDYIYHCTGQCRFIWREVKKRIGRNPNLVVKYIRTETGQPNGLLVSYKMDIMALVCQRFS